MPRVAFIVRSTFDTIPGGDTIQASCTARELRKLGVAVDIIRAPETPDYRKYDLLHLFNLCRPADHLFHIAGSGLPYVVSTIYLDYSRYDTLGRSTPMRHLFRFAGKYHSEYLKTCFRVIHGQERLASRSYLKGHRRAILKILSGAGMLLPNSLSEFTRISSDFQLPNDYRVIPNGIDPGIFHIMKKISRSDDTVLCVGQIYSLKNQHLLIEATRRLGVKLVIIGKSPPNHHGYLDYCKKIAHRHVEFHDFMPQEQLAVHYAKARVHALPSWFETTGLSSLEAGAMGCNLVVGTGGDTQAYFHDHASFCDAQEPQSLQTALETELNRQNTSDFRDLILNHYTWQNAAVKTLAAYQTVPGLAS
jgi:glycosyltransferase involved in cell wall biosynthesis